MISSGDTAWVLTSSALVFIMVPGLAFFYAGLVRGKNALSTLLQSFIALAIVGLSWVLWGYSLAFGPDIGGFIGNLQWAGLHGVSAIEAGPYAETIPHQAFMIFQAKFAIITPALIAGAFAERIKFSSFVIFIIAWSTIVYPPLAHWMWGNGGWLGEMGALDFAGGAVVHISSGAAALAAAIIFGRRLGFGQADMNPHNVPFVVLGASLLFILPAGAADRRFTLTWKEAVQIDWGTILLFGGGLSLGQMMFATGLAEAIGRGLIAVSGAETLWGVTAMALAAAIALTNLTSNTATAAMLTPVVLSIAAASGLNPIPPALAVAFGCGVPYMLPIATPPNAIVYGSGMVPITSMIKLGFVMCVAGFICMFGLLRLMLPLLGFA